MNESITFICNGDPSRHDHVTFICDPTDRESPLSLRLQSEDDFVYIKRQEIKQLAEFFIENAEELGLNED